MNALIMPVSLVVGDIIIIIIIIITYTYKLIKLRVLFRRYWYHKLYFKNKISHAQRNIM